MDPLSAALMTFGVVLLASSWIYLIIVSFENDYNWGICSVFVPVLSYIYACFAWQKAKAPLSLAVWGWAAVILALL